MVTVMDAHYKNNYLFRSETILRWADTTFCLLLIDFVNNGTNNY